MPENRYDGGKVSIDQHGSETIGHAFYVLLLIAYLSSWLRNRFTNYPDVVLHKEKRFEIFMRSRV